MNAIDLEFLSPYIKNFDNINTNCGFCGKKLDIDNVFMIDNFPFSTDKGLICKECSDKLPHCDKCHKIVDADYEFYHIHDINQDFCYDCFENYAFTCFNCGKYHYHKQAYIQLHGNICSNCYLEVDHFCCDNCDGEFLADRYGTDDICITCANERVSNCLNYTFKPTARFHSTEEESNKDNLLFMGVELECGHAQTADDVIKFIDYNANGFFYMKRDASIPAYGCEVVTHPATFKYHIEQAKWKKLTDSAIKYGLESDNDQCGIHIHVSRNYFTSDDIMKLDYFVNSYSSFWKKISRRESHYSAYVDKCTNEWGRQTTDRHCALNLSNYNTVELRIFKGTLDVDILFSYLEITYHLCNFIKTIEDVQHSKTLENFQYYLLDNGSANLKEYLNTVL